MPPSHSPTATLALNNLPERSNNIPWIIASKRRLFVVLAVMFCCHVLIRLASSPVADLDESEQLVLAQEFHWGYGPQPPLYTWLQIGVFRVFGVSIFALSLLKNILLFGLYVFTYLSARFITRNHLLAAVATLSLLLIPQIAWESQRDLTHSVLVTTATAVTLFLFLRLREKRTTLSYCLLGCASGLGLLSKYNFAFFLCALLVAGLCSKSYRALLISWRIGFFVVMILAIIAPHFCWAWQHPDEALGAIPKLKMTGVNAVGYPFLVGILKVSNAVLPNLVPLTLFYALWHWRFLSRDTPLNRDADAARLVALTCVMTLVLQIVAVFTFKITGLRGRWFQPLFACAPLLFVSFLRHALKPQAVRLLLYLATLVAFAVAIAIPVRARLLKTSRSELAGVPFAASEAGQATLRIADRIIAENFYLGGNIRLLFPNKLVLTPRFAPTPAKTGDNVVIVFDATRRALPAPAAQDLLRLTTGHPAERWNISYTGPPGSPARQGMQLGVATPRL